MSGEIIFSAIQIITNDDSKKKHVDAAVEALYSLFHASIEIDSDKEFSHLIRILHSNIALRSAVASYRAKKSQAADLNNIKIHLNNYLRLVSYACTYQVIKVKGNKKEELKASSEEVKDSGKNDLKVDKKEEKVPPLGPEDKSGLKQAENILNGIGRASGETATITIEATSTLLRYGELLSPHLIALFQTWRHRLGPLSYVVYGFAAIATALTKIYKLIKKDVTQHPIIPPPHAHPIYNSISAVVNLAVSFCYISGGIIFAGSWAAMAGWGLAFGAIGTWLGWFGNNIIDSFLLKKENEELRQIGSDFGDPLIAELLKLKTRDYKIEYFNMIHYILMCLCMTCFAWASFVAAPALVPYLGISYWSFAGAALGVYYAKEGIADALSWIDNHKAILVIAGLGFLVWACCLPATAVTVPFLELSWPAFLSGSCFVWVIKDAVKWIGNKICCGSQGNDALGDDASSGNELVPSSNGMPGRQPYKLLSGHSVDDAKRQLSHEVQSSIDQPLPGWQPPPPTAPGYVAPTTSPKEEGGAYTPGFYTANGMGLSITPSAPPAEDVFGQSYFPVR